MRTIIPMLIAEMPAAPDVGLVTRYLFESSYLVGGLLLLIAGVAMWSGARDGLPS